MTSIKETISLLREKIKKFKENEDYSVSSKNGKEVYAVKSQELKKKLREVIDFNPASGNNSITHTIKQCDNEGNCFSYKGKKETGGTSFDEMALQKKEVKKEKKNSYEEVERVRKEVEKKRKEVEQLRKEEQERRERGLPTSDYASETHITTDKKGDEEVGSFNSSRKEKDSLEQEFQQRQSERPQFQGEEGRY